MTLTSAAADIWKQHEFDDLGPVPAKGHSLTFSQSIRTLVQNLFPILLFPKVILRSAPLRSWRLASSAYSEFRDYIFLLTQRAKLLGPTEGERANLLHALVSGSSDVSRDSLSDDEVLAHMFTYVLAGHESTGNTMAYAIVNLAIFQEAQDWFLGQLDEQLKACQAGSEGMWDYSTTHGSLPAVISLMNESLRLYPACAAVPKWTADAPAEIHSNGHKYIVPPRTPVVINTIAVHRDPKLWGEDVLEFRPQRWIEDSPRKGQFMAFSEGARACLGKKFAQVEFVAVIATLFSRFRLELDCGPGENIEIVRDRAIATLDGSTILANLGMTKEVPIRFVERV
ncbi:cytochrome P450 [Auricularia subglabra TFB-10046 SS5]|uniref:Cytochrome P450 n=1 Tax=Auricularia subglabra (strain TFB-10046 / SS5) TaxID=717982 RepID=J0D2G2_AURST|nr:cytochrome P450 [Auricularia subglabra TFB-10046 SS5]